MGIGLVGMYGFCSYVEYDHDTREWFASDYPEYDAKVRQYWDLGKLDKDKTVWELVDQKEATEPFTESAEQTVVVSSGGVVVTTFTVEPGMTATTLHKKIEEATGGTLTEDSMRSQGGIAKLVQFAEPEGNLHG